MDAHTTTQTGRCNHQAAGALQFNDGCWNCGHCGRRLQVAEAPRAWQVFGQVSRWAAYCAVLAACVPVGLNFVPGAGCMTTAAAVAASETSHPTLVAMGSLRTAPLASHQNAREALLVASH